jgi:DNA-3-methyladenine glycosylase I
MVEGMEGLRPGADGRLRCAWQGGVPEYDAYHDEEWGRPVEDANRLFEKLCLEGFQAGLSWLTILRKREAFRQAFAGFDFHVVAGFGEAEVHRLLGNTGIVRHRQKIESAINNARRAIELEREFGSLASYFWRFEPDAGERPERLDLRTLMSLAATPHSIALAKDLKRRGWSFVGPTTVYAFMQAMGMVNDHLQGCWCRSACEEERERFRRPA